jgi:ubiquinol-cytochrome c reductase cytochrome c1 subunit
MLKYEDGTPASTPQMAHDVATFLDFLENKQYPDIRLNAYMVLTSIAIWCSISWFYIKYHDFNLHSYRHEAYALRDGSGYMKFREKAWRNHRNQWLYRGEYS